jgi:4'-phosphopantetheinyl transferase
LAADPAALRFQVGPNGKPVLDPDRLTFNLSHSGEIALVAVGGARQVGVDIERIREDVAALDIARQFFPSEEASLLGALPPEKQQIAFFEMWTRKEALGKARGLVLGQALRDAVDSTADWSVEPLKAPAGYAAAVAAEGHDWAVRWDPF